MINFPIAILPGSHLSEDPSNKTRNGGVARKRMLTRYLNGWTYDSVFEHNENGVALASDTQKHNLEIVTQRETEHWYEKEPVVKVGVESDAEIKRRTNFKSEKELLAYIIIVCNGDWEIMTKSYSGILTWYEKWFFFFEFCWGRTITRWIDAASYKNYGISAPFLRKYLMKSYFVC